MSNIFGDCPYCEKLFDLGAEIVDGRIKKVFILKEVIPINLIDITKK